jgi:hypothetical protein
MPASISVQRLYHPAVLEFDAAECHHEGAFRQHLVRQQRGGTDRRMHGVTLLRYRWCAPTTGL